MKKQATTITIIVLSVILLIMTAFIVMSVMYQNNTPSQPASTPEVIAKTPEPTPNIIAVTDVSIELESVEILKGTRFKPDIIIQPHNATDKLYEIHSDDEKILRYLGGNWLAADLGSANLTVTAANGITASVRITVIPPELEALSFLEDEIILEPEDIVFLNPILTPADAVPFDPIVYTTSNERVAIVARDGRLTALDTGIARITASVGNINTEIRVRVVVPIKNISIVMPRRVFSIGDNTQFTIQLDPANATDEYIDIKFSGAAVTQIGETAFRCDEAGDVTITVTTENNKTASMLVKVIDLAAFADEVLRLTNLERGNAGVSHLTRTSTLNQIALIRARETIQLFSHNRPDGRWFLTVFADNGITYSDAGENLAMGQETPAEVVKAWMDSPGHKENMLYSDFGRIGIGVAMDNSGKLYWTQLFTD